MKCRAYLLALYAIVSLAVVAGAGVKDPFQGDAFHALVAAQDTELQQALEALGLEARGNLVTGPLNPFFEGDEETARLMSLPRVVCPDLEERAQVAADIENAKAFSRVRLTAYEEHPMTGGAAGFRGVVVELRTGGDRHRLLLTTVQQTRWLIWVRDVAATGVADVTAGGFDRYAVVVSDYLRAVDQALAAADTMPAPPGPPSGLPEEAAFYPPRPPYVIDGYQNYKNLIKAHEDVDTDFARGITAFVPGDSLREAMIEGAPASAWPNKEEPLIQHEYREFFDRGGDVAALGTLTAEMIPQLERGEYFFAVGLTGKIRFGYETPREEVDRIERETGRKMARANHAFLFPGEPV
ncbi:MAG TPA: hypothetical protein ENO14_03990, partial [Chromatiales bacterium]|nr:hypothetical protein [Chromatiales bacterium]